MLKFGNVNIFRFLSSIWSDSFNCKFTESYFGKMFLGFSENVTQFLELIIGCQKFRVKYLTKSTIQNPVLMDCRKMATMFWKRKVLSFTKIGYLKMKIFEIGKNLIRKAFVGKLCCLSGNQNCFKQTVKPSHSFLSLHLVDKNSNTLIIRRTKEITLGS